MEQVAILDVLRRHLVMIVVLGVITTLVGLGFCMALSNSYTASALVLVRPQQPIKLSSSKDSSKEFLDFPMGSGSSVETASKNYIEIIKSPALIGEVVRQLGLDKEKPKEASKAEKLLPGFVYVPLHAAMLSVKYALTYLQYGKIIEDNPTARAIKSVGAGLSLEATADTYLFQLKYNSIDPQEAADVVNTTARTLIQFVDQLRLTESRRQLDYLKGELEQSRQRMATARGRLEAYKQSHAVFLPEKEYDAKLRVISELEVELAKAQESLVGNQSNLSTVSLAARRATLIRLLAERKAELAPLPEMERELMQLDQDVKDSVAAYEIVDKEFKEAELKESYQMPEVQMVSPGTAPTLPSGPKRPMIVGIALVSGLVAAAGLAFLLEYLNRGVRGIEDIEDYVGIKVIATIPRIPPTHWKRAGLA